MEVSNEKIRSKVNDIITEKQLITSLDFTTAQDKEVALQCLKEKQRLATQLDAYDDNQREVLNKWVQLSYSNLLLLNKEQLHPELIDTYLYARLCDPASAVMGVSVYNGYEQEHVIAFQHETKDSAAVCYFDKEWGLPVYLKSVVRLKFKITNALALVKKVDFELSCISLNRVVKMLVATVDDTAREVLLNIIDKKNLNFYQLSGKYAEIGSLLVDALNAKLSAHGIVATEAFVVSINVPDIIRERLENQYFALAEMERIKQRENKWEADSLKLYEAKAAIHSKYPDYPVTLTEAEKDKALERHLKRMDSEFNAYNTNVWRKGEKEHDHDEITEVLPPKPIPPIKPTAPQGSSKWRTLFIIAAIVVAAAGALLMGLVSLVAGGIVLGVGAIGFVLLGIIKRDVLKDGISEAERIVYSEKLSRYDDEQRSYEKAMAEYNRIDALLQKKAEAKKKAEEEAKKAAAEAKKKEETSN